MFNEQRADEPQRTRHGWLLQVSSAASALCVWVHAIYLYANVAKDVAPKRARLKDAQVWSSHFYLSSTHVCRVEHVLPT